MKYIKSFENTDLNPPKLDDYIVLKVEYKDYENEIHKELEYFFNNTIGIIIYIYQSGSVNIEYDNIPDNIKPHLEQREINDNVIYYVYAQKQEISYYSENKQDVEIYLHANKYNI